MLHTYNIYFEKISGSNRLLSILAGVKMTPNGASSVNQVFYKQIKGAPMGSPISGLLAEIKLRPLEHQILNNCKLKPEVWLRYVDDMFIIWNYSIDELNDFLQDINAIDENIKFTLEIQNNKKTLSYLDVELTRNNGKLDRNVYRKLNRSNHIVNVFKFLRKYM